jgi:hypothetical protein
MNSRQAAPVNEGAEHAAIAEMSRGCLDPSEIEFKKLRVVHFAGGHRELAMGASGDIAGDFHVIGLVGQDKPRRGIALHQAGDHRGVGCIAADQPVRPQLKHVAKTSHRDGTGGGGKRALLKGLRIPNEDLIDLVEAEA